MKNSDYDGSENDNPPFDKIQNFQEDDMQSQNSNKTFSELVKAENKDLPPYRGIENAELLNSFDPSIGGFTVDVKEQGFSRVTDVILFCHGTVPERDSYKFEDRGQHFVVPCNTKIYEYETNIDIIKDGQISLPAD